MMELSLTRAPLQRGSDAEPNDGFPPIEPIPAGIANGRCGATAGVAIDAHEGLQWVDTASSIPRMQMAALWAQMCHFRQAPAQGRLAPNSAVGLCFNKGSAADRKLAITGPLSIPADAYLVTKLQTLIGPMKDQVSR
jgi:hypothetical protein